uniref:response regulator n=1 Tax=Alistipes sp. TaxID=1872444 RepID=UPI004056A15A
MEYRIILVDDHALFRGGLKNLLEQVGPCRVVAEAASGEEFLGLIPSTACDVVFMDISMPGMDGAETTRRALALRPELRIVTLSMFGDEHYYTRMVEAGACGFLLKDSAIDEVLEAIYTVSEGESYFSKQLLDSLSSHLRSSSTPLSEDALSARELEILVAVCRGNSNQEIADELFISKRTVDKHRANILEKTGCKNTADLVVYAIRHGLFEI